MAISLLSAEVSANDTGLKCEVLAIGGGGGGGDYHNTVFLTGGAGAGGLANATITLPIGSNAVVVGNGGVGNGDTSQLGENGGESSIGPIIALGGAGSQGHGNPAAQTYAERSRFGGCGAGASARRDSSTGEGLPGLGLQGNDGGACFDHITSGGGGGQGEAGKVAPARNDGGDGGDGTSAYDTWLAATSQGELSGGLRYIGGGGGGCGYTGTSGSGGLGGGADGALSGTGANATANTGGGAGGMLNGTPGNGGSGLVIVRYSNANGQLATGGTVVNSGGYYYHTFTSSGTLTVSTTATMPRTDIAAEGAGSGGTEVTSGGYKYHTFTSSGTFTVSQRGTFEVLVVAGGGAGGYRYAGIANNFGGGGAGGVINDTVYLPTGNHTVVIGAGGAIDNIPNGDHSSLGTYLTAFGGGKGAGYQNGNPSTAPQVGLAVAGYNGGSGGGGYAEVAPYNLWIGRGVENQGNNGGIGGTAAGSSQGAGGGGGAGADGADGTASVGGDGGDGINLSTWATATSTGDSGYYAGGGGGARYSGSAGSGGSGGGGKGDDRGSGSDSTSGSANTGGGGGGSYSSLAPGAGGSGIVIIRYAV